jgi:hypothetical protein
MAGVSLVSGRQEDSRVELLGGWGACLLRRVISSLMVEICRSFRITTLGTYHGASFIRRRAFD